MWKDCLTLFLCRWMCSSTLARLPLSIMHPRLRAKNVTLLSSRLHLCLSLIPGSYRCPRRGASSAFCGLPYDANILRNVASPLSPRCPCCADLSSSPMGKVTLLLAKGFYRLIATQPTSFQSRLLVVIFQVNQCSLDSLLKICSWLPKPGCFMYPIPLRYSGGKQIKSISVNWFG